jgi:predicted adenine nucleotide alpha hydrolase (AANH) superfamily ATPase
MKLLLHTCCAPCSVYCIKTLRAEGIEPTLYWFNPNIHPYAEYKARRDCLRDYAKSIDVALVEDDAYGLDEFVCNVADKLTTRCQDYCYPKRLRQAFAYAKENGYDAISTTLLYSIYQQHDFIVKLMQLLSAEFGIEFIYRDFREGWQEGQDEARRIGLYMQKYCGCVFSEEESGIGREIGRKLKKQGVSPTNANVRKLIETNKVDNLVVPSKLSEAVSAPSNIG